MRMKMRLQTTFLKIQRKSLRRYSEFEGRVRRREQSLFL